MSTGPFMPAAPRPAAPALPGASARRLRSSAPAITAALLPVFGLACPAARADALEPIAQSVVVTATRSDKTVDDTPVRTEVVTRREIERTNARTLKEALENVPGLQLREVHGKSGYELSLQGLSSDQVLVLIDGLPISASTGSTVDLSQYLLIDVERIEVIKGASSAQYGSAAMGGVINVITRRMQPGLAAMASGDVGSYGDQNASGDAGRPGTWHGQARVEGGSDEWRWRIAGDGLDDNGFATDPTLWPRQGDAQRRAQAAARLGWHPDRAGEFWLDANRYREDDEQRYEFFAPPNRVPQRKTEAITRQRVVAGGRWQWPGGLRATLKGVDERYDSLSQEYSNDVLIGTRTSEQRMDHVSAQLDLPEWRSQWWQIGFDWHREQLDQDNNGSSELAGGNALRTSHEVYVQDDVFLGDRWELLAGLRWQHDSDFGAHAAPKLALRGTLVSDADWRVVARAAVGQGYRVPNLKERHYLFDHSSLGYVVIGNPDLKPESSDSFQLGGTFGYRQQVTLDVNAYLNRVKDLIQTDLANPVVVNGIAAYTYENVARARTSGVETALSWRIAPSLGLSAAYTLTRAIDEDTGGELTRRPRHMARLGLDWDIVDGTQVTLRSRYQSSELVDSASGARSPAWRAVDLKFSQRLGRGFTAFAGIDNVFDRQRDFTNPNDFGPIAGRYVYLGLSVVLGAER